MAPATDPYEFHDRAVQVHSHWLAGYAECEIAAYFKITEADVNLDLQHIRHALTSRQLLATNNDRARLVLQREEQKNYNRLMKESLTIGASDYIKAGMSPAGVMREFREAVGMTEKPGGVSISFNKNTGFIVGPPGNGGNSTQIRSQEDMIRAIIAADPSLGLAPVEVDAHEVIDLPESEEDAEDDDSGSLQDATDDNQ